MIKLTKKQQTEIGSKLARLLGLKPNILGRYDTGIGDKTDLGLYLTLKRFITDYEHQAIGFKPID